MTRGFRKIRELFFAVVNAPQTFSAMFLSLLAAFLFGLVVVTLLGWTVYSRTLINKNIETDMAMNDLAERQFGVAFRDLANDTTRVRRNLEQWVGEDKYVRMLANLEGSGAAGAKALEDEFSWLIDLKESYDKIRLISADGRELVKVANTAAGAVVAPPEKLEDTTTQVYYNDGAKLASGGFAISQITLNKEGAVVERPPKPVVRGIRAIHNPKNGELLGLIVINLDARPLLERLREEFANTDSRYHVVAEDGTWILSPDGQNEWSGDLNEGSSFAETYPVIWQAVQAAPQGGSEIGGLTVVSKTMRIVPGEAPDSIKSFRPSLASNGQEAVRNLYIIGLAPRPDLIAFIGTHPVTSWLIGGSYFVLALLLSFIFAVMIFQRKHARAQLKEQYDFNDAVINSMVDGLVVIDEKGKILDTNPAIEKTFGYSRKELIGANVKILMRGEHHTNHDQYLKNYRDTGEAKIIGGGREVPGFRKDGTQLDIDLSVNEFKLNEKRVFVGNLKDVTERKSERRRYMKELEAMNEDLGRSNADLEQFAYVASHDLKAPLRAIDNLSQWIEEDLEGKLEGETQENMKLLRGRVNRLELLLDDILQYSRAGRVKGALAKIDVNELIKNIDGIVNRPDGFKISAKGKLPTVIAPQGVIDQVFGNLINNALKHHDRDAGTITVSAKDRGDRWEFAIEDDGPGIPPEFHDRIFKMFQKLKARDQAEGSGMGLAIIKKLIMTQGGEIKVHSSKGKRGAKFTFTWLKEQANAPQREKQGA